MESLAVETSHDLDHTCSIQRLLGPQGGGRYLKYRPPLVGNCFHRPPLVVAAAPPPLHDVAHRSAGAPPRRPASLGRFPVSFLASPRPRATRASGGTWSLVTSSLLAGCDTTSSATLADLVLLGGSPLSNGGSDVED